MHLSNFFISSPYSNTNAYLARKDDEFDVNARTYEYIPEMPPPPAHAIAMRMPHAAAAAASVCLPPPPI